MGAGEMTQRLRTLAALEEDQGLIPRTTWWLILSIIPVPGDLMPFSGIYKYKVCMWCINICAV